MERCLPSNTTAFILEGVQIDKDNKLLRFTKKRMDGSFATEAVLFFKTATQLRGTETGGANVVYTRVG